MLVKEAKFYQFQQLGNRTCLLDNRVAADVSFLTSADADADVEIHIRADADADVEIHIRADADADF